MIFQLKIKSFFLERSQQQNYIEYQQQKAAQSSLGESQQLNISQIGTLIKNSNSFNELHSKQRDPTTPYVYNNAALS